MTEEKKHSNAPIFASILGGLLFLVFQFLFHFHPLFSIGAGIAGFIAGMFLFYRSKEINFKMLGLTQETVDQIIREGREKLSELFGYSSQIKDKNLKQKVDSIGHVIDKILKDVKEDPKDAKSAKQFLSYYLEATLKILRQYVNLSSKGSNSTEVRNTLRKVESSLDLIKSAADKQYSKLLEDDVLNLDTEVKLLERTIKMEGLGEDELKKKATS